MKLQGEYQGVSVLNGKLLLPYVVLQTFSEGLLPDHVKTEYLDETFQLPDKLSKYKKRILDKKEKEAKEAGRVLFDGKLVRLVDYFPNEDEGFLKLILQPTSFFAHTSSNKALEELVDELGGKTPLQFYNLDPKELDNVLANPIGVNSALVTKDNYVIIVERSKKLSQYPGLYGVPAGFMNPEDKTPHRTGYREIKEEVGDFDAEVMLVEIGRALDDFHIEINMIGKIDEKKSRISEAIIKSEWESKGKYFVPFNPRDCAEYLMTTITEIPSNVPKSNWITGKSPKWVPAHHRVLYLALVNEYGQEDVHKALHNSLVK